jgi:hypothetical protein
MTRCTWLITAPNSTPSHPITSMCPEAAVAFFREDGGCRAWCQKHMDIMVGRRYPSFPGVNGRPTMAVRLITEQEFLEWQLVRQVQES